MKAARAWAVPYTVFTGERMPGDRWTARDRTLAEALVEYEESFCPGCGQPKSKAWDESTEGYWELQTVHCFACQSMEDKKHGKGYEEPEPGDMTYMVLPE